MKTGMLLRGLALGLLTLLVVGCDDDKPCATCSEPDPAVVAALDYINSHRAELGLRDEVDQLIPYRVQKDELGMTHVRCYQYYQGVRVDGGELIVHLSADLEVIHVSNGVFRDVQVDVEAAISCWTAARIAKDDFHADGHHSRQQGAAEKVVFRWIDTDHLCWFIVLLDIDGFDGREYYVDAHSGAIVHWRSLIIE